MKKIIYIYIFLFSTSLFSQVEFICGTPEVSDANRTTTNPPPNVDPTTIHKTYNIFFWRINKNDGSYTTGGNPLTPQMVTQAMEILNNAFADANICFNLIGMDTINSTIHHNGSNLWAIHNYAVTNGYAKPNAFNVYVPYRLEYASGTADFNTTHLTLNDVNIVSVTLAHEIGHCFNLRHPHQGWNSSSCEHVTRDVSDPDYNAGTMYIGDELVDTNAAPNFYNEQRIHIINAINDYNSNNNNINTPPAEIAKNGFDNNAQATEIEQALQDYGFTDNEINYIRDNGFLGYAYVDEATCSYTPDNRINDPNSPFFKDCIGTPYQITEDDCRNYMAYSYHSCQDNFTSEQIIRMHQAIIIDEHGDFALAESDIPYDLYMQDTETDLGQEPNIHTDIFWTSKDIWVRNQNDGTTVQEHQNPVYAPNQSNYVYVKVRNKSCQTSSGNDQLKLYWAKANTALSWPFHWNGDLTITDTNGQEVLMGDEIGTLNIPPISGGESTILEFTWQVPNPSDYMSINNDDQPWHFCLLARIVSNDDPMSFSEGNFITDNVKNNNNIAWKNLSIIELNPNFPSQTGAIVAIGNFFDIPKDFNLEFFSDDQVGKPIYEEAEVSIMLDDVIYNAWDINGKISENYINTNEESRIIAENNHAYIKNIHLLPGEIGTISVDFNFLTKEITDKTKYVYHLIQRDASTNEIIGGETFEIRKAIRPVFDADAGDDKEIEKNQLITITANDINEDATYNWYDTDGNLIYTGTDLSVSPDVTKKYKLEIVSNIDGFKDYDEIEVKVKPYRIVAISPNPANNNVDIEYIVTGASSAYLMIVNLITGDTDNFILDTQSSNINIDISAYADGIYNVILVCDGQVQNSINLSKE